MKVGWLGSHITPAIENQMEENIAMKRKPQAPLKGYIWGIGVSTLLMDNQMERNMEDKIETTMQEFYYTVGRIKPPCWNSRARSSSSFV